MEKTLLLCLCCLLLSISASASVPSKYSLGISPQDESYYKSNVISCKDGSKKFKREQLNDEFCDCPDGTDEPGTSACPLGKFYCINSGHIPRTIFSSRVNDGICDCCDGSDEYDETLNCPNTCWEAGKVARDKLNKKIETYQQGVVIRKREVEKAKQAFAKDEEDLSMLKSEERILKELVDKLKEHKERIEKAEEEERLKKEKEENRLREAERKAKEQDNSDEVPPAPANAVHEESSQQDTTEVVHDAIVEALSGHNAEAELSSDHAAGQVAEQDHDKTYEQTADDHSGSGKESSGIVANQEANDQDNTVLEDGSKGFPGNDQTYSNHATKQDEGRDDISGLSKEELGRRIASRWTKEDATHKTDEVITAEKDEFDEDFPASASEEDDDGYSSETDDDRHKYDDDEVDDDGDEYVDDHVESDGSYNPGEYDKDDNLDIPDLSSLSWLDKIKQTVQNVLSSFNFFKIPVDLSEAGRVRKEYDDAKSKLSKIQSRISSLTEKLKHDFGKEKEFYSFYDRCFENKQNKYVYKVCPFKQASQIEGHSTTRLGQWDNFEESYRVMLFLRGEKCWNGPDRSLKVRLRCGLTNDLSDVDEPSRCEYVAILSTPALCLEDKLKELQQKLELMITGQPQSHDEL